MSKHYKMISISGSPAERLAALKRAIDEEVNSVGAALRHTFMTKIPTAEDIKQTCNTIAMKLMEGEASQIECKLALVDLLDEALHGMYIVTNPNTNPCIFISRNLYFFSDVTVYEPEADMIFNYLMVSALAKATDIIEKKNLKATGGKEYVIY